ncbi:hypothetical protein I552_7844 [Mycobacterium xenopi 3993]|nr:hypothetical protein I552_7844 [Mycobacterium xenopi 3993]
MWSMPDLPPITLDSDVDAADRASAIDFINRVNLLFDAWDIDAMVEAFLPDGVTYHTHGVSRAERKSVVSSSGPTRTAPGCQQTRDQPDRRS